MRPTLPGGQARRQRSAGVAAGSPRTRIHGPVEALGLVADALRQAELALGGMLGSDVGALPTVAGHLVEAGGKRLRPALTALAAMAIGARPEARLFAVGELIHLGSLLHDDVVDQGDVRRGRASAHILHGNAVAVLAGDFCVARGLAVAAEVGGFRASASLADTVAEMAEGEVLQLQAAGDLSTPIEVYEQVIARKTSSLIAWCCAAPAWLIEDEASAEALLAYGRGVGMAFQITDDVLDFKPATGKPPGADLRERKLTLPLLHALQRVGGLRERLEASVPEGEALAGMLREVRDSGALEAALDVARAEVDSALGALDALPDTSDASALRAREALRVLGRYLVERSL